MKVKLPKNWKESDKKYLTSSQVAYISGLSQASIIRALRDGKLRAGRTPGGHFRILREDAVDYLETLNIKPGQKVLDLVSTL